MDRPAEIVWFERLIFGTLVLGLIQTWLDWPRISALGGPGFAITVDIFTFGIISGLTLLISRGRSRIAKWISVTFIMLGFIFFVIQAAKGQLLGIPVIIALQTVGQLVAAALLFTPAARDWMRRTPNDRPV